MATLSHGVVPASVLVTGKTPRWLKEWGRFAARLSLEDIPPEAIARARLVTLDCLGAILAGHGEPEVKKAAKRLNKSFRARKSGAPALEAFLDGTAGTMLEIDEGNQYARGHPGIHVLPALVAATRLRDATGAEFLRALVLGYEIGARIGMASKLRVTMHPHGTWGVIGAALGVAALNKANARAIIATINLASSLGLTTSRRTMLEGATVRNSYAGFSNMMGIMAWDLVSAGFTGEADGVGSVYGGIAADQWQPEVMTDALGTRWEIARNYFKRHAACRYTHGAIDALMAILRQRGAVPKPAEIRSVLVETYVWAAQLDHKAPDNMLAAKFSLPFALATTLVNGSASLDAFRDAARQDAITRDLASRVTVAEDPALTAMLPGLRPARVTLELTSGERLVAEVRTNKGDTEDPYSQDDVIAKFREIADPRLGASRAEAIVTQALMLDALPSARGFLAQAALGLGGGQA
jgi:2-methylcitrate dehydratase PrpD